MLKKLRLRDVGPALSFDIEFSDRLNIFTGDNGLGKSFILDIAWWALDRRLGRPYRLAAARERSASATRIPIEQQSGCSESPDK